MLSMSLDLEGQRGHQVEQGTTPPEHEKEEQCEEPEQGWPCRGATVSPGTPPLLPRNAVEDREEQGTTAAEDVRSPPQLI
jgi:hypothetical protein